MTDDTLDFRDRGTDEFAAWCTENGGELDIDEGRDGEITDYTCRKNGELIKVRDHTENPKHDNNYQVSFRQDHDGVNLRWGSTYGTAFTFYDEIARYMDEHGNIPDEFGSDSPETLVFRNEDDTPAGGLAVELE